MVVGLKIEFVGTDKVLALLRRMETGMTPAMEKEVIGVAEKVRDHAKMIVPVDTGSLRQSIRLQHVARPAKNTIQLGVTAGGYITNPKTGKVVDYARLVEYTQPYMRPAMAAYRNELREALRRAWAANKRQAK